MKLTLYLVLSLTIARDHTTHNSVSRLLNDEKLRPTELPEQREFHQVKMLKIYLKNLHEKLRNRKTTLITASKTQPNRILTAIMTYLIRTISGHEK